MFTFIRMTFGLTWLLDLYIYLSGGMKAPYLYAFIPLALIVVLILRDPLWKEQSHA